MGLNALEGVEDWMDDMATKLAEMGCEKLRISYHPECMKDHWWWRASCEKLGTRYVATGISIPEALRALLKKLVAQKL